MGFEVIDENMANVINSLNVYANSHFGTLTNIGQALSSVFVLFIVAQEAFKVLAKGEGFDILAIIRPIAFGLVITFWIGFVDAISFVPNAIGNYFKKQFEVEQITIKSEMKKRYEAATKVYDITRNKKGATDMAEAQTTDMNVFEKVISTGKELLDNMREQIASWALVKTVWLNEWAERAVLWVGEVIWQVNIYLIFLLQASFSAILIIFGPISFAASILPIWKDAWQQWLSRFISVQLYGSMAYVILCMTLQLVLYGIQKDTEILVRVATDDTAYATYAAYNSSSFGTATMYFIAILTGAMALKWVPEAASWIIPSHAGHAGREFMRGMISTPIQAARMASNAAFK